MRAFIAVDLSDEVREQLTKVCAQLRRIDIRASWVKPENLHVTVCFLGEMDRRKLFAVQQQLDRGSAGLVPFTATLRGVGFFPSSRRPRVFYAAIDQHDRFRQLARQLDVALSPLGFGREQSFIPHITLARIKGARHLSLLRSELKGMELKAPSFPVAGLTLYSSILHPLGVRYDVLYRSRFQSF